MNMRRHAATTLVISVLGLAAIAQYESGNVIHTEAYLDDVGIPTICDGHTKGVFLGQVATPGECEVFLKEDTTYAGRAVTRCTKVPLTQEQYDALVSLTFNVGAAAYCQSTLARKLNAGDCRGAGAQFDRWVYAGGRKLRGLVKRRADERRRFETGCVSLPS